MVSEINQFVDSLGTTLESIEATVFRAEQIKERELKEKLLAELNKVRDTLYLVEESVNDWEE